jgi:hypothetical protein
MRPTRRCGYDGKLRRAVVGMVSKLYLSRVFVAKTHSRRDIDSLNAVTQGLLLLVGNSVGDDELGQLGLVELFYSIAGEDAVGDDGDSAAGSVFNNDLGGLAESAASVGHVVDDDGDLAANITDQDHAGDLVGTGAFLVDESEAEVETVGNGSSSLGTTGVGRDNDTVLDLEVVADPAEGAGLGVEVVDRDVEEALDLRGVEIHSDDMVAASGLKHVSHQTGSDGGARFVLLVLASVGEVRQDGSDAAGRGSLASVDHDEQLHDSIVDVAGGGGLQHKDWTRQSVSCIWFSKPLVCHTILVADRLADADARLVVGVLEDHDLGQLNSQTVAGIVSVVCAACWAVVHAMMDGQKFFVCARAGWMMDSHSRQRQGRTYRLATSSAS